MLAAYDGRPEFEHRERLRRRLHADRGCVLVAERAPARREPSDRDRVLLAGRGAGSLVVGTGRVAWLEPEGERAAPHGYYLVGLVVDRAHRRTGVGEALTRARTEWALAHAPAAWCFANAANRASLDLHARAGLVEVTRDFIVPGVSFEGAEGVLCRATAASVQVAHARPSAPGGSPTSGPAAPAAPDSTESWRS